ncbi:MAG: AbrB/MazE/SpoVT family DNA-binding domain-containing protein [Gammaproteobacteria bacterium]|nr:AbrB/MazE/SpoVT family DNA-binding domain-containing protein [Gammaproteobacteria bacterium]
MRATVTAKGQVTVPKPIRDKLKLTPGDRVEFVLDSRDEVRVFPVRTSVRRLKGMVTKPPKPVALEQMDDAIAQAYARRR